MIKWKEIDKDDFSAEHKNYLLRVEQMDTDMWWWGVFDNSGIMARVTGGFEPGKESAKQKAEGYLK